MPDRKQKRQEQRARKAARDAEIARQQEEKDEKLIPQIQRKPVYSKARDEQGREIEESQGAALRGPRVVRNGSGQSFMLGSQVFSLYQRVLRRGGRALIKSRHVRAAERFLGEWERLSGGIGVGKSDYLSRVMAACMSSSHARAHDSRILAQIREHSEFVQTCEAMGAALPILIHVCIHNIDLKQWCTAKDMEQHAASGYLAACLDRLADHYKIPQGNEGNKAA